MQITSVISRMEREKEENNLKLLNFYLNFTVNEDTEISKLRKLILHCKTNVQKVT